MGFFQPAEVRVSILPQLGHARARAAEGEKQGQQEGSVGDKVHEGS